MTRHDDPDTTTPGAALVALSEWIDARNADRDPEALHLHRVIKVGEEAGEAFSALIGWLGANPRKGVTHTASDVVDELLDVAVTALGAIEHLNGHDDSALSLLNQKIITVATRAGVVSPARVSTLAELDALPVGSVVRGDDGHAWEKVYATFTTRAVWHTLRSYGDYEPSAPGLLPATLLHVPGRDLLAEAEARGYERGKRDALTEAAADLPWTYRQQSGLPDHAERLARWLRARAGETPGGAA